MKEEKKAIIELVSATFLFSLFGVFTRLIANEIGVFLQLLIRVGLMTLLFYLIGFLKRIFIPIRTHDLPLFLFRGLLVIADFSFFYVAVNNLSLGMTLFIFYASSVITSYIYGKFFLKEQLTTRKYAALGTAILGLGIMYSESFSSLTLVPAIAAALSGICFALTTSTSKNLTKVYTSIQINLTAYIVSTTFLIPLLFFSGEFIPTHISIQTIAELIGFSVVGVLAFYLTLEGYARLEAQKASLFMLMELIFVVIIGYFFYKEIPTIHTIIGGLCILIALAIPNVYIKRKV